MRTSLLQYSQRRGMPCRGVQFNQKVLRITCENTRCCSFIVEQLGERVLAYFSPLNVTQWHGTTHLFDAKKPALRSFALSVVKKYAVM